MRKILYVAAGLIALAPLTLAAGPALAKPAAVAAHATHRHAARPHNWPSGGAEIQFVDANGNGIGINASGAAVGASDRSNSEVFYTNYYDDDGYFNLTDYGPNGSGGCLFYSARYNDFRLNACGSNIGSTFSELFFSVSSNTFSGICSAYNGNDCLWWNGNGAHILSAGESGNNNDDRWNLENVF